MISFRGKFWFNILRLFRWRLGALLKVTEQKKQKNKFEFWRKAPFSPRIGPINLALSGLLGDSILTTSAP